jgi:glutathione S-transferase
MCIHTAGLRDFIMKVPAADGDAWMSVVMDNGATEDADAAAKRLQAYARQKEARKEVVKRFVQQQCGAETVEPDGTGMMLYVRAGKDPTVPGDCPFCHKVLLALRLKDISPTLVTVSSDARAPGLNLMGQNPGVPTLALANGTAFTESETILEYLQREHSDRGTTLMVDGNEDIARALSPLWDTLQAWYAEPAGPNCPMRGLLEEAVADLETRCARLAPDAFLLNTAEMSAIDCNVAPKLFHLQIVAKQIKGWDFTETTPELAAYMDRVFTSDAFKVRTALPRNAILCYTILFSRVIAYVRALGSWIASYIDGMGNTGCPTDTGSTCVCTRGLFAGNCAE